MTCDAKVYVTLGDPRPDPTTCDVCGFDAVHTFPVAGITERGVWKFPDFTTCVRCYDKLGKR